MREGDREFVSPQRGPQRGGTTHIASAYPQNLGPRMIVRVSRRYATYAHFSMRIPALKREATHIQPLRGVHLIGIRIRGYDHFQLHRYGSG